MYETGRISHTLGIGLRIGTVQSEVHLEVGELLLDRVELVHIGSLLQGTSTIPERYGTLRLLGLEEVHQVAAHRRHTCTTTDEDQLLRVGQVLIEEELAVGARDRHLVTRLAREDVRRADTRVHLHKAAIHAIKRRRCDTDVEHDDIALCGVIGHRVGTEGRLGVGRNEVPHLEVVPIATELLVDIHVRELDLVVLRNVDLNVTTAAEVERLALGELDDELFEEGRDIAVRNHLALPLLHAEYRLRHTNLHVLLHLHLAAQTPMLLGHLARDETRLGRQQLATALHDLALAHTASTTATTSRGEEDLVIGQRSQERRAALGLNDLVAVVHINRNSARRGQFRLCKEKQTHQNEGYYQKGNDCN